MHVLDNGICTTCNPHVFVDGQCTTCSPMMRSFDPDEPRDPHSGKWSSVGGAAKDLLKLAGRLGDEKVVASGKLKTRDGNIFMATTQVGGERHLRFGLPEFDANSGDALPWRPNGPYTANLDTHGVETLRHGLGELDQLGRERVKKAKAIADKMDAAPKGSAAYKAAQADWFKVAGDGQLIGEGSAHAQDGAVIVYRMTMDQEPSVQIAVRPPHAPDSWNVDQAVQNADGGLDLNLAEFGRLRKQLDAMVA